MSFQTGAPVAGAQVSIPSQGLGSLTNSQGQFLITGVPAGTHEVRVELVGFAALARDVTVASGQSASFDFVLRDESKVFAYGEPPISEVDAWHGQLVQPIRTACTTDDEGVWLHDVSPRPGDPPERVRLYTEGRPATLSDLIDPTRPDSNPLPLETLCQGDALRLRGYYYSMQGEPGLKGRLEVIGYVPR